MQIEPSKTYLTAAGYVVAIVQDNDNGELLSTVETSPGVMYNGKNIHEINSCCFGNASTLGWYYDEDGICTSINTEWQGKLRIIEELPFSLPVIPKGFKWKDGFPQYRVPVIGEHAVCWNGSKFINDTLVCDKEFLSIVGLDLRRLIVEPVSVALPKETVQTESSSTQYYKLLPKETALFIKRVGNRMGFVYASDLEPNLKYFWGISDDREVIEGRWVEITKEEADKIIIESKTPEKPDLTESGKYKLLGSGDRFTKGVTECDSKGTFNKCDYSGNVSDHMRFNFRDPVVASPQKYRDIDPIKDTPEDHDEFLNESSGRWIVRNSVNGKKNASFDLTTKYRRPITVPVSPVPSGMVEVTHLPDYVVKRNGDGYLTGGEFILARNLVGISEFAVKWYTDIKPDTYKLYATQENYNEWLASQEAQRKKVVDESRAKLMGNTVVKINGEEIKGAKVSHQMETIKVKLSEGETSTVREQIKKAADQGFSWSLPEQLTAGYNNKPTMRQRAFKYWLGDPIKTIAKEVKTALPYIVLGGSAWGITYSVFHIEEIKDLYNKHVPSVSISIDAPEIISSKPFTK